MSNPLHPTLPSSTRLRLRDIAEAIRWGWVQYRAMPLSSSAYAALFALPGLGLLLMLAAYGLSPMALPLAGGFMLLGPILLSGFFALLEQHHDDHPPGLADALRAMSRTPKNVWLLALVCAFLFLIWVTDAAVLYSFTLGGRDIDLFSNWAGGQADDLLRFEFWAGVMGSALAYLIFAISAFAVPLLYERRSNLLAAVNASVRAVLGNTLVCLAWGITLATVILLSILLLPLLLLSLPVMAYASMALYRTAFGADHRDIPHGT